MHTHILNNTHTTSTAFHHVPRLHWRVPSWPEAVPLAVELTFLHSAPTRSVLARQNRRKEYNNTHSCGAQHTYDMHSCGVPDMYDTHSCGAQLTHVYQLPYITRGRGTLPYIPPALHPPWILAIKMRASHLPPLQKFLHKSLITISCDVVVSQ